MMEEAPRRLPLQHPDPESFMRSFQPPADTRFYAAVASLHVPGVLERAEGTR